MDTPLCLPHKASLIFKNSLSLPKTYKTKRSWLKKKENRTISESQIFFCERIMIIIRIMSAWARLIFLMRIFPSQERQFLDPSSPSVNYGNRKPFHVGTVKLLCLSKWFDLINNCKFIKKERWYQSVSLFYYKVQHVFQCATIRISDVNNELITRRPRCPSLPFQGDWKKCTMRIYIRFIELSEFRNRQKLVIYISHMHFMISIISKFVKVFSCTFDYYT